MFSCCSNSKLVYGKDSRIGSISIHSDFACRVRVAVRPFNKMIVFVRNGFERHFGSCIVSTGTGYFAVFAVHRQRITALRVT